MHNFQSCLNLLSMPNMSLRSKHKKQRQIMQIYCRRLCTTRVSNRNSVARNCVKLRPTVGNYAQLFSYCVELWGVYRARNCAQVKFTCIENSICSLLNWLKRNFKDRSLIWVFHGQLNSLLAVDGYWSYFLKTSLAGEKPEK